MIKFKNIILAIILVTSISCAKKEEIIITDPSLSLPEIDYIAAKRLLDEQSYEEALESFNNIEKKYPLSKWGLKSKLMIIFIHYLRVDYDNASIQVERFINKYPDYKDIDYAYYLKALIAYEQIKNPELDTSNTHKALDYFEELIRRYPESKYSKDAVQKIILINTVLAGKDMNVGMYYLETNEYLAALNRFKKVIDSYEANRYTPEALYRIVEIYYILGMFEDSKKIAAVLGYNYPESIWYKKSYKIVGDTNTDNSDDKGWADKILKKIF